ncbi:MAG: class I SAM-dependent methyltransferase [Methanophagales archaeon]|nr:class I SAM-dependent methyltransferase [Methanophagales archaeon]
MNKKPQPKLWNDTWKNVKNIVINYANRGIFNEILKYVNFANKEVIEHDCGTGRLSYLAYKQGAKKVILVDFSDKALDLAKKLSKGIHSIEFWKKNILEIKEKGVADIAFSSGVVEHFKGKNMLKAAVQSHKDLIQNGGKVIIVVPYSTKGNTKRSKSLKNIKRYGFQRPLSEKEMLELFSEVGLEVVVMKRFQFSYSFNWLGNILNILNNRFQIYLPLTFLDRWGVIVGNRSKKSSKVNDKLHVDR